MTTLRVVYGGWGTQRDVPLDHVMPLKFNLVGFRSLYKWRNVGEGGWAWIHANPKHFAETLPAAARARSEAALRNWRAALQRQYEVANGLQRRRSKVEARVWRKAVGWTWAGPWDNLVVMARDGDVTLQKGEVHAGDVTDGVYYRARVVFKRYGPGEEAPLTEQERKQVARAGGVRGPCAARTWRPWRRRRPASPM